MGFRVVDQRERVGPAGRIGVTVMVLHLDFDGGE